MAKRDQQIDRLFELPPEEFTAARNELARRLKQEGDARASAEVQALTKPSLPAWTINQLARQERDALRRLLGAGEKLRKAQERALGGVGSGDALRTAQAEEREAVQALTRAAERVLDEADRPATRNVLDRIASTLRAAAVTESGRSGLRAGRLSGEIASAGFEALAELHAAAPSRARGPRDELAERRRRKAQRERKRRELEKRVRELEDRADSAEQAAEEAERAAAEAQERAEAARRLADEAEAELESLDDGG